MVRYAYFPGCVGQDSCKELDMSTKLIAHELGLELVVPEVVKSTEHGLDDQDREEEAGHDGLSQGSAKTPD